MNEDLFAQRLAFRVEGAIFNPRLPYGTIDVSLIDLDLERDVDFDCYMFFPDPEGPLDNVGDWLKKMLEEFELRRSF